MTGTIVTILLLIVLTVFALVKTVRRGRDNSGCCAMSEMPEKVRVKDRSRGHYPYSFRAAVDGMTCTGCARRVENALNQLDGIWARVHIENHEVQILAKEKPSEQTLREAVREAGYILRPLIADR